MQLEIITPEKKVFKGEVKQVRLPGTKGSFEILERHAPIISTLERGTVRVVDKQGEKLFFEIEGGVVENSANKIIVLAETI